MANAFYTITGSKYGNNLTQSNLNNNMSGNVANDIYKATHGGSTGTLYTAGNTAAQSPGANVTYAKPAETPKQTSTSSGGSSSGSANIDLSALVGGNQGGGFDYNAYLENLASQRIAALKEAYGASRGTIDQAYQSTLQHINDAYNQSYGLLQQNYNSANESLNNSYNNSVSGVQDDAAQALREAYVNRMMQQRNLGQQMSAMGLSGGATESTLAKLSNNYGNARNNINTTLNKNISNLAANRDASLAEILQNFNSNLSNLNQNRASSLTSAEQNRAGALAQIEQALANGIANAYSDNFGGVMSLLGNQMNYQNNVNLSGLSMRNDILKSVLENGLKRIGNTPIDAATANNLVNLISTSQGSVGDIANTTNWEAYLEAMRAAGLI